MGNNQNLNPQIPQIRQQQWQQISTSTQLRQMGQHVGEYQTPKGGQNFQYGQYRTLRSIATGRLIDEYTIIFPDQQQFKLYLQSFIWRLKQPNIVKTFYLKQQHSKQFCAKTYSVKVYIQNIKNRLSDITDIPYPENLYVLLSTLQGYQSLYEALGYFHVEQTQICFDEEGHVRVWVTSDLSKNYPSIEQQYNGDQMTMVHEIVNLITQNTDGQSEPNTKFKDYFINNSERNVGFEEAIYLLNEYAKQNNIDIPTQFESILKIYQKQQDEEEQQQINQDIQQSEVHQSKINLQKPHQYAQYSHQKQQHQPASHQPKTQNANHLNSSNQNHQFSEIKHYQHNYQKINSPTQFQFAYPQQYPHNYQNQNHNLQMYSPRMQVPPQSNFVIKPQPYFHMGHMGPMYQPSYQRPQANQGSHFIINQRLPQININTVSQQSYTKSQHPFIPQNSFGVGLNTLPVQTSFSKQNIKNSPIKNINRLANNNILNSYQDSPPEKNYSEVIKENKHNSLTINLFNQNIQNSKNSGQKQYIQKLIDHSHEQYQKQDNQQNIYSKQRQRSNLSFQPQSQHQNQYQQQKIKSMHTRQNKQNNISSQKQQKKQQYSNLFRNIHRQQYMQSNNEKNKAIYFTVDTSQQLDPEIASDLKRMYPNA